MIQRMVGTHLLDMKSGIAGTANDACDATSELAKNREAFASPSCMLGSQTYEDKARNRIALTVTDTVSLMQLSQKRP